MRLWTTQQVESSLKNAAIHYQTQPPILEQREPVGNVCLNLPPTGLMRNFPFFSPSGGWVARRISTAPSGSCCRWRCAVALYCTTRRRNTHGTEDRELLSPARSPPDRFARRGPSVTVSCSHRALTEPARSPPDRFARRGPSVTVSCSHRALTDFVNTLSGLSK